MDNGQRKGKILTILSKDLAVKWSRKIDKGLCQHDFLRQISKTMSHNKDAAERENNDTGMKWES